jgi:hypothetical protein
LRSHARRISLGKESLTSGLGFTTNALFADDDDDDAVTLFLILFGGRSAVVLAATESIIGASPDNNNNNNNSPLDKVQTFPLKKGSLDTNFT